MVVWGKVTGRVVRLLGKAPDGLYFEELVIELGGNTTAATEALAVLTAGGFVRESRPVVRGRTRTHYELTPAGRG